jgi:group I intron endonuclease
MFDLNDYKDLPKLPGLYKLHDINTGKFYVGSSMNLRHRISNHLYRFKRNNHNNPILQAIWNKEPSRLRYEILFVFEKTSKDDLLKAEQIQLDKSNVGENQLCMNILRIAGSHYGRKRPAETVEKLRNINKGRSPSQEAREKMRAAKLGRKLTEEHKAKISTKGKKINRPFGIKFKHRKLSAEQVIELRRLRSEGLSWRMLANKYQLNQSVTKRIAIGKTYRDIK